MSTLLQEIEAFLDRHEMAASTFGDAALGDRHFVRQLRAGRRVWDQTSSKVRSFMSEYEADVPSSCGKSADVAAQERAA